MSGSASRWAASRTPTAATRPGPRRLDWDVHHGNGTQKLFYDDPTVLTISLHQSNIQMDESTGSSEERGKITRARCAIETDGRQTGQQDRDNVAHVDDEAHGSRPYLRLWQ
jgi:hypothetical protein